MYITRDAKYYQVFDIEMLPEAERHMSLERGYRSAMVTQHLSHLSDTLATSDSPASQG